MTARSEADTVRNSFVVPIRDADEALNLCILFDPPACDQRGTGRGAVMPHARPPAQWSRVVVNRARRWLGRWRELKP